MGGAGLEAKVWQFVFNFCLIFFAFKKLLFLRALRNIYEFKQIKVSYQCGIKHFEYILSDVEYI